MEFVKGLLKTKDAKKAYAAAYPNAKPSTVRSTSTSILKKPHIIKAIRLKFAPAGLTPEYVRSSTVEYIEKGKKNRYYASAGAGLLRFAGQILGMVKDDGAGGSGDGLTINFNILNLSPDAISQRAAALAGNVASSIDATTTPPPINAEVNVKLDTTNGGAGAVLPHASSPGDHQDASPPPLP